MKITYLVENMDSSLRNRTSSAIASNINNQTSQIPTMDRARSKWRRFGSFAKLVLGICFCLLGSWSTRAFSLYDHQMNPDGSPLGTLSLVTANPNDHWTWVPNNPLPAPTNIVITYKFDQNFINFFSSAQDTGFGPGLYQIEDQVRMALNRWSTSSDCSYNGDPSDNLYGTSDDFIYGIGSYARISTANNNVNAQLVTGVPNNFQTFVDIRTATLHELGHVMGLAHPCTTNTAYNFRYFPYTSQIPAIQSAALTYGPGGPGNPYVNTLAGGQTPTGGEVMSPVEGPGWINHIPSWDDLDGYNISYANTTVTFEEVFSNTPAQITFTTYNANDPTVVANGIPYGRLQDPNPMDGVLITNGIVEYNTGCMYQIGFARHGINWNIRPGQKLDTLYFDIHGSDDLNCASYNGTPETYNGAFANAVEMPFSDPIDFKDDTTWEWTGPTPDPIQSTSTVHVGFSLDVQDWTIASAGLSYNGGSEVGLPMMSISFEDFYPGAPGLETALNSNPNSNSKATALTTIPSNSALYGSGGSNSVSHGLYLVAPKSASSAITVSDLQIADVTGMGLTFSNLTSALLNQLSTSGQMTTVSNFGPYTLQPEQAIAVVLQGSAANLPTNIVQNGNYLVYNRPDLAGKELFAYWKSSANGALVENFALAGEPPIVTAPVPALTIRQQSGNTNNGLLTWPFPSTGYQLQQSASPQNSSWNAIATYPTLVSNFNQQAVSTGNGSQFFRLKKYTISQ